MSEYIKKSSIIGLAHKMQFGRILTEREVEVVEMVVNSVSDDAVVEVVRCRDCKWWVREGNDSYGYAMFCDHDCSLGGQGIKKPEDYCSYGERKGGSDGAADN